MACWLGCEGLSALLLIADSGVLKSAANFTGILNLILRLLLCSLLSVAGYFLVYHRTARYQDAKSWIEERINLVLYIKRENMI